ncbi:hypothetical protein BV898_10493 [Hypsibius exemplaris]|uniref:Uncharacterized protein n=1 Tax=Hypsibius exemplaris TaxID=2072580 RepID=A0A1W0WJ62_HYPEX|nr:hypothetical protein BV898_10493 [Hypsibius exemplaris]
MTNEWINWLIQEETSAAMRMYRRCLTSQTILYDPPWMPNLSPINEAQQKLGYWNRLTFSALQEMTGRFLTETSVGCTSQIKTLPSP